MTMYLDGFFGISREQFLTHLNKHEKDRYYLGAPYVGIDIRNPNGNAKNRYGYAGMNCTGFVWSALKSAGADIHYIPIMRGSLNCWQNPSRIGVNTWSRLMRGDQNGIKIKRYKFKSVKALLASGKAEKGDIIYMHPNGGTSPKTGSLL